MGVHARARCSVRKVHALASVERRSRETRETRAAAAFQAVFNLPNAFMLTPLIVNSFMKAYGVD